ncbi:MAG TPA: hypothetical protein VEA38_12785 [Terriglobales bacterium]|nr:hypothetical protein [Terriglobales bacterium]
MPARAGADAKLGGAILGLKLVLGALLGSHFLTQLFVPFLTLAVGRPGESPWRLAAEAGIPNAFPYGPVMYYVMAAPRWIVAPLLGPDPRVVTSLHLLAARVPLLVADGAILWLLLRRLGTPARRTLLLWWASPLVLYVSYVHGQLDLIPTAMLLGALVLLDGGRPLVAGAVLALGMAAKSHLVIALPFMAIFAARAHGLAAGAGLTAVALATYALALFPWVFDPGFRAMVFGSDEHGRMFAVAQPFGAGLRVLLAPLAIWLLLLRFAMQRQPTRETLFMFLGLAYVVTIALVPAAHGYYIWPLPFVIYFFAARARDSLAPVWAFNGAALAFLMLGRDSTLLASAPPWAAAAVAPTALLARAAGIDAALLDSLLFTLLQGAVIVLALMMYRHGVSSRIIRHDRRRPTLIGIAGDSGSGKHTLRDALADVLGGERLVTVNGDDVHRWERGHPMWKVVSHLDPSGNDLFMQLRHAEALDDGQIVSRVRYDHATGRFTEPQDLSPRDYVVFVGLHPFYLKRMRELLDVKIYLDTDEALRVRWKVQRDVARRGYPADAVLQEIERRAPDAERHVRPQRDVADLIVRHYVPPDARAETDVGVELQMSNDVRPLAALADRLASVPDGPSVRHAQGLTLQTLDVRGPLAASTAEAIAAELLSDARGLLGSTPRWRAGTDGVVQLAVLCLLADRRAARA